MYKIIALLGLSAGMILSFVFHGSLLAVTYFTLPFLAKKPIDVPPIVSVELIQISDVTNIPYAPKAAKIIDKLKKKNEKVLSEKAPPKKVEKEDTKQVNSDIKKENIKKDQNKKVNVDFQQDNTNQTKEKKVPTPETKENVLKKDKAEAITMPDKKEEKIIKSEQKQQQPSKEIQKKVADKEKKIKPKKKLKNDKIIKEFVESKKPIKDDAKAKQVSEFNKDDLFDINEIKGLIDQSLENIGETTNKTKKITQSQDSSMINSSDLTLAEEDLLKAQIFGCWSIPLGLPYNEDLLVRIRLKLKQDGRIIDSEVLDHARMNKPGQSFYKILAESALRALTNPKCVPLKVPTAGYERWKELQLNFDPREMLGG